MPSYPETKSKIGAPDGSPVPNPKKGSQGSITK